jgi:hypothetical protein
MFTKWFRAHIPIKYFDAKQFPKQVPRRHISTLTAEQFHQEFESKNLPVVISGFQLP